jgi:hypothetical protein
MSDHPGRLLDDGEPGILEEDGDGEILWLEIARSRIRELENDELSPMHFSRWFRGAPGEPDAALPDQPGERGARMNAGELVGQRAIKPNGLRA